jgi:hypothetical protein
MIAALSHLATSFGLAGSAGLNAYLPLLIVALTARFTTLITLNPPFDLLTDNLVIAAIVVLLLIETLVDKIPAVDTLNDGIQTFVRPAAGAVLFAANANVIGDMNPALALICGLLVAFSVHGVKATARPLITGLTGGVANPIVSVAEDAVSATATVTALVAPLLGFVVLLALVLVFVAWRRRRRHPVSRVS